MSDDLHTSIHKSDGHFSLHSTPTAHLDSSAMANNAVPTRNPGPSSSNVLGHNVRFVPFTSATNLVSQESTQLTSVFQACSFSGNVTINVTKSGSKTESNIQGNALKF